MLHHLLYLSGAALLLHVLIHGTATPHSHSSPCQAPVSCYALRLLITWRFLLRRLNIKISVSLRKKVCYTNACVLKITMNSKSYHGGKIMDYKNAGVDIEAGYKAVELMKKHVEQTMRPGSSYRYRWIFRRIFIKKFYGDERTYIGFRY